MAHSWKNYLGVLSVAVYAAISGLAVSAAADDLRTCSTDQGAVATAACTAAITSGTLHGHELAVAYLNRGLLQEKQGQHSDAVSDLNEAIRLDPNFAAAFLDRGVAYQNMGQYELAVQDYNRTIALDPNSATSYFNSGLVYRHTTLRRGDFGL
jgi:Flp pilus assembly protein TadD